jgi:hypothetical protein
LDGNYYFCFVFCVGWKQEHQKKRTIFNWIHRHPFLLILFTRRNLGSPGAAFGHSRDTVASRSPDSWQHMHERSVCHSFDPET